MAKLCLLIALYIYTAIFASPSVAVTDVPDVETLQYLYRIIHSPRQLKNWKLYGGDPCGESWMGVQCLGSSITHLKLQGLDLSGNLRLDHLNNLKQLDLSSNKFEGSIPSELSSNVTHINLARNNLTKNIPYSFHFMKNLQYLNLSYNSLSGPLGELFNGLENIRELDLSFNYFTGNLPTSFTSLKSVTHLFLQNNVFTGSVTLLANLPLMELNIEHNHFNGVIPKEFQSIHNLRIEGNEFDNGTNYPHTGDPTTNSSATESHPSQFTENPNKRSHNVEIVLVVGGVALFAICAVIIIASRRHRSSWRRLKSKNSDDSDNSFRVCSLQGADMT